MLFRKIIAVVMAVLLSASCCFTAFAADAVDNDQAPVIIVGGMAVMPLTLNAGTNDEKRVWPLTSSSIFSAVAGLVKPVAEMVLHNDWNSFADDAFPQIHNLFDPIACDNNGNSKYKVTTTQYPDAAAQYPAIYKDENVDELGLVRTAAEYFGGTNVYFFVYDWRLDPIEHARALNTYIENVKIKTAHEKVVLIPCSMGGTVVASYLKLYGSKSVQTCIMLSTAIGGVASVGELFKKDVMVDKDALLLRIKQLGKKGFSKAALPVFLDGLDNLGVFDFVTPLTDNFLNNLGDRFFSEIIAQTYATMPGIWALVADKDYEQAKKTMLNETDNAELIKKIDYYHYNVQANVGDILKSAMHDGVNVSIVAQYNMQGLPVSVSYNNNNDLLIDTMYASGGAVCAPLSQTLGEGYKQQNTSCGHNHLSGDNVIDASTCILPEQTWFIKNMPHIDFPYGSEAAAFVMWLAESRKQVNVFTNSDYPQFTDFDYNSGLLTPIKATQEDSPASPFSIIVQIIKYCSQLFREQEENS